MVARVWQSRRPLWATDTTQDTRLDRVALARGIGMRGAFVFPVISDGSVIGVLAFNSRELREPEERLMEAISVIGTQIGQFLQRKRREEELRRFRTAMDVSEDMIWLIDPVRIKVIDVNNTVCRKLGYASAESLAMSPHDMVYIVIEEL